MESEFIQKLNERFTSLDAFQAAVEELKGARFVNISGLRGLSKALAVTLLAEHITGPVLWITPSFEKAKVNFKNLTGILGRGVKRPAYIAEEENGENGEDAPLEREPEPDRQAFLFDDIDLLSQDFLSLNDVEVMYFRYQALEKLALNRKPVIVISKRSLLSPLISPERFKQNIITLKEGDEINKPDVIGKLIGMGYRLVTRVEEVGEVSSRGGIVDIFPLGRDLPIRVDLFGDEVESIREFDPITQRGQARVNNLVVSPCFEANVVGTPDAAEMLDEEGNYLQDTMGGGIELPPLREFTPTEKDEFVKGQYAFFDKATILDYLPDNAVIVLESPDLIFTESLRGAIQPAMGEEGDVEAGDGAYLPEYEIIGIEPAEIRKTLEGWGNINLLSELDGTRARTIQFEMSEIRKPTGSFEKRLLELSDAHKKEDIFIITRSRIRVKDVLQEIGRDVSIDYGDMEDGFAAEGFRVLLDTELFPQKLPMFVRSKGRKRALTREELKSIRLGDYVVHVDHGIGVFGGITQQDVSGVTRDFIFIEYAGGDKLYVPVEQVDQIFKYSSSEGTAPKVHRLGASDWDKLKRRIKKKLLDITAELFTLYKRRIHAEGYQFGEDTPWQRQVEDDFEYQETPAQLKSMAEIKHDMESAKPMDRLVCGEVGYGKTELAIRAALKSVLAGKQVALLVPTTILAMQHYHTFTGRLHGLPVRVELLSRFKSQSEQKKIVKKIAEGEIDIVIGTHRLLSKDVSFKDLGLLVVDEEQKFGVRHKEKIKSMKVNVDVLTLTATPIPRTLYMSLVGLRDISMVDTPPPDRLPVKTYVRKYSANLVKNAILEEMSRGGQVYYLYNRVETIEKVHERIRHMIPQAHVAVGHGQMDDVALEKVMLEFMSGEYDVLLCTTIIESGLDIPNVNTLIVENAQNFGLAQLHQLRGRVGRSSRQAYSYFLYPQARELPGLAVKRLEALTSFSHLGAGYEIAKRDLELRGAGNILGAEQHGFITQIGFDLYARMMNEAIEEVSTGVEPELEHAGKSKEPSTVLNLPISARIPVDYVYDSSERLSIYRRLADVDDEQGLELIRDEFTDRFGIYPVDVANLLDMVGLKIYMKQLGIRELSYSIATKEMDAIFPREFVNSHKFQRILNFAKRSAKLRPLLDGIRRRFVKPPPDLIATSRAYLDELKESII